MSLPSLFRFTVICPIDSPHLDSLRLVLLSSLYYYPHFKYIELQNQNSLCTLAWKYLEGKTDFIAKTPTSLFEKGYKSMQVCFRLGFCTDPGVDRICSHLRLEILGAVCKVCDKQHTQLNTKGVFSHLIGDSEFPQD